MSADFLKRELISHTRRVCSLYKKMCRDLDFAEEDFFEARFKKLIVRSKFDKYKDIKDIRRAKALLQEGIEEFNKNADPFHIHGPPFHAFSKEGIAYNRNKLSPDYVMDTYHPLEKAQYPYYFAKREQMKEEYIKMWKKKMMTPRGDDKE